MLPLWKLQCFQYLIIEWLTNQREKQHRGPLMISKGVCYGIKLTTATCRDCQTPALWILLKNKHQSGAQVVFLDTGIQP